MEPPSHTPFGLAVLDYFNGDHSATLVVYDQFGGKHHSPISLFFRGASEFPSWERKAIELCKGRVLDVGAGVGRHSLALQDRGLSACAVEVVPECVEVMRRRGVKEAHCADIFTFEAEPFDTVLCLMNGLSVAGGMAGLESLLARLRHLIEPDGSVLVDSTDVRESPDLRALLRAEDGVDRYFGEMELQMEYKGARGQPFKELYIDPDTLTDVALSGGWTCQILLREKNGRYLAQLQPAQSLEPFARPRG